MKNEYKCIGLTLMETEMRIREIAMQNMLSPSYYDKQSERYAQAVPYYNDGVLTMAEALISALKEEAGADADF